MSLDKPKLCTYAWRITLIGVIAAGILVLGFNHSRAWLSPGSRLVAGPPRVQTAPAADPFQGSTLLRSYNVAYNGEPTHFSEYCSTLPAEKVVEQFEERYGKVTGTSPVGKAIPLSTQESATEGTMVRVVAPAYSLAGARDSQGKTIGIVAFEDPKGGGSRYFIGRASPPSGAWRQGDVPGDEVRGIPRPLRSRRVLCVDGLGGIPSRLLVYEGWGAIADTVDLFAAEMPKAGWTRNRDVETVIQKRLPGAFLSFLNGTRRAMIYIEREETTGKVRTAVAYTVKSWLPPDRGL